MSIWSTCETCKKNFQNTKVIPWCDDCNTEMNKSWEGHKNLSSSDENTGEKNQNAFTQTPFGELKSLLSSEPITSETKKSDNKNQETNTMQIKTPEISEELSGDNKTQSDNVPLVRTETSAETLPTVLQNQNANFEKEILHSINSLNVLETGLFDSIKDLKTKEPDKLYDPNRIEIAISCGHQIVMGMKMKLELLKFAKELR